MASDLRRIERALLSVSDKTGLVGFARVLNARGIELVSTGGTRQELVAAGLPVRDVADLTGFPELMDGRLKTLHPLVHGGLLAQRENPTHEAAMLAHNIAPIDLLVVNLYPFEATVLRGASREDCVENIDIGGPAMIRAAAKNHADVAVVVDLGDYDALRAELESHAGATRAEFRRSLAQKAFARTAAYDATIALWLEDTGSEAGAAPYRAFGGTLQGELRYGENPHQRAGFYRTLDRGPGIGGARQFGGKPLSYNNIGDADAALGLVAEFDPAREAAVAIIKHANPCGVAIGPDAIDAYREALRCDPVSAFGGVVALNRRLDGATAAEIVKTFTEAVVAPEADETARAILAGKKNLRLLLTGALPDPRVPGLSWRNVSGGFLVQDRDTADIDGMDLTIVTKRAPTEKELADLKFGFRVVKHVKSNAIVLAKGGASVGIGAGQMSRVDAVRIAAWKAEDAAREAGEPGSLAEGAVVASAAFFPFPDGVEAAASAGATAVIQPGGSLRDGDVIAAADRAGLAMVFTGVRHFRH